MTNDYDTQRMPKYLEGTRDLDAQQMPQHQYGEQPHGEGAYIPDDRRRREETIGSMPEAAAIRSRLATNLRTSVEEAHNLATFYSNFAQTLELCLSQLETKK